jgi:hypothetical protein
MSKMTAAMDGGGTAGAIEDKRDGAAPGAGRRDRLTAEAAPRPTPLLRYSPIP